MTDGPFFPKYEVSGKYIYISLVDQAPDRPNTRLKEEKFIKTVSIKKPKKAIRIAEKAAEKLNREVNFARFLEDELNDPNQNWLKGN